MCPIHAENMHKRGLFYLHVRQYDIAIADFTAVLNGNPDYLFAVYNRGLAYQGKGEYDKAIADFDKAIRLSPTFSLPYISTVSLGNAKVSTPGRSSSIIRLSKSIPLIPTRTATSRGC